ncbi:MAG TPA: universal stress protein [Gemmatimonadaceae bacterium]
MYRRILMALENGPADEAIIPHVAEMARRLGSEVLLLHVADGWAARNFNLFQLAESEEMKIDRAYLETIAARLRSQGLTVAMLLALGDPAKEILKTAESEKCSLIAMTSHGHRLFGDLIHGSTIHEVRHSTSIPILLVRAGQKKPD